MKNHDQVGRITFYVVIVLVLGSPVSASALDSLNQKTRSLIVTPRFNTSNMAPVTGNIINRHVNMDLTLVYSKNNFMWTFVNAVDLEDQRSEMNYLFTNIRYKINLARPFSVTPFLAFYSEHAHQVFDKGSDANGGMMVTYQQGGVTVEAFALLLRLTSKETVMDAIKRLEVKFRFQRFVFSGLMFYNTGYLDNKERLAIGFRALLPEFTVFKNLNARAEIHGSFRVFENPETRNLNGVFLSLAFPIRF
jgi:hypothetical protein